MIPAAAAAAEEEDNTRCIEMSTTPPRGRRRQRIPPPPPPPPPVDEKTAAELPPHQMIPPHRRVLDRPLWQRTADCTILQIRQKLAGYVHQDQRKGRETAVPALTVEATLALLEAVDYQCTYCGCCMERVWRAPRDPRQWTLDRIDNARSHQIDNVVPSCMECNLRRRARGHWGFRRGAEIVAAGISKVDDDGDDSSSSSPKKKKKTTRCSGGGGGGGGKKKNWEDEWTLVKIG